MAYSEKNLNALLKRTVDFKLDSSTLNVVASEGEPITVIGSNDLCSVGFYLPFLSIENKISSVISLQELQILGQEQKASYLKDLTNPNFRWTIREDADVNKALTYITYRANTYPDSRNIEYIEIKSDCISYISSYQVRNLYLTSFFEQSLPLSETLYLSIDSFKVISKFLKLFKITSLFISKEENTITVYTDKGFITTQLEEVASISFEPLTNYDSHIQINSFNYEYLTDSSYEELINKCSIDGLIRFNVDIQSEGRVHKDSLYFDEVLLFGSLNYPTIEAKSTDLDIKLLSKLVTCCKDVQLSFIIKYLDLYKALRLLSDLKDMQATYTLSFSLNSHLVKVAIASVADALIPLYKAC